MIPIFVKNYTWRQTSEHVIIYVKEFHSGKSIDFSLFESYVKASCPPFIMELFLWESINVDKSTVTVTDDIAIFSLQKTKADIEWPCLECPDMTKDMKRDLREQYLKDATSLAEEESKAKSEKRSILQRQAVQAQISLDGETIERIDRARNSHRREAMEEFEDWKSKVAKPILALEDGVLQENRIDADRHSNKFKLEKKVEAEGSSKFDSNESKVDSPDQTDDSDKDDEEHLPPANRIPTNRPRWKGAGKIFDEPKKALPTVRNSNTIDIKFTNRVFPTPARERYHLEEQEWLEKQAEARRNVKVEKSDRRPEEDDPTWLKDTGDDFYKAGNHLSAINAYSQGIKIAESMASLYVNRSAAYYAVENYEACVEDCTKALELMVPKCEENRQPRAICYARRGAALCKLSDSNKGIEDLEVAQQVAKENSSITHDVIIAKDYFSPV